MPFGTLYYKPLSPRSSWLIALAKYLGIEIDCKDVSNSPEFPSLFPLRRVPAFVTEKGFRLTEMIAIAFYFTQKAGKKEFFGITDEEKASNLRWVSFINSDLSNSAFALHTASTDEEKFKAFENFKSNMTFIDNQLSETKFLNGETPLLSDMYACCIFSAMEGYKIELNEFANIARYLAEIKSHQIGKIL